MKKIIKEKKQNKIDDMIINDQKEIEEEPQVKSQILTIQ